MRLLILIIPIFIYGESLKSLLDFSTQNSDLVVSKTLTQKAKSINIQAKKSAPKQTWIEEACDVGCKAPKAVFVRSASLLTHSRKIKIN